MRHYDVGLDEVMAAANEMNTNATGGILYEYGNEYIIRGILSTDRSGSWAKPSSSVWAMSP